MLCGPCNKKNKKVAAAVFCNECENELLCKRCGKRHSIQTIYKTHVLQDVEKYPSTTSSDDDHEIYCDLCKALGETCVASAICFECNKERLCVDCQEFHKIEIRTKMHKLQPISCYGNITEERLSNAETTIKTDIVNDTEYKPGRPTAVSIGFESIKLHWTKPAAFDDGDYFQISCSENFSKTWTILTENITDELHTITDLKSETKYVFRVRVIHKGWEGPQSDESRCVKTVRSAAANILENPSCLSFPDTIPKKYELPMKEKERDVHAKIRVLKHGRRKNKQSSTEKTIMLIGETGTGKSTMVDGLANYILGVKWEDPFRFKMVRLESDEQQNSSNQSMSQTEWITCYIMRPLTGGRLDYSITVIDTPGFGDTRGINKDKEIFKQISTLFMSKPPKGVLNIDAICFIVKASECRLTQTQIYIFDSLLSLFGKDIEQNIFSFITFADSEDPPVFEALKAYGMPFEQRFMFNNLALFSKNINIKQYISEFWQIGTNSFRTFFTFLESVTSKSLQLTKKVVKERFRLETHLFNFEQMLKTALYNINHIDEEIECLQKHRETIKNNAVFKYKVKELQKVKEHLPKGQNTTTCIFCEFTCHPICSRAEDRKKKGCMVMKKEFCTVCPNLCSWTFHKNRPFKYILVEQEVEKTYVEMKKKYENASNEALNQAQVIQLKLNEVIELFKQMEDLIHKVTSCNDRLAAIALRPTQCSREDYINMMIENQKHENKPGFMERIQALNELKNGVWFKKKYEEITSRMNAFGEIQPPLNL